MWFYGIEPRGSAWVSPSTTSRWEGLTPTLPCVSSPCWRLSHRTGHRWPIDLPWRCGGEQEPPCSAWSPCHCATGALLRQASHSMSPSTMNRNSHDIRHGPSPSSRRIYRNCRVTVRSLHHGASIGIAEWLWGLSTTTRTAPPGARQTTADTTPSPLRCLGAPPGRHGPLRHHRRTRTASSWRPVHHGSITLLGDTPLRTHPHLRRSLLCVGAGLRGRLEGVLEGGGQRNHDVHDGVLIWAQARYGGSVSKRAIFRMS
jgi:hypothetical protein